MRAFENKETEFKGIKVVGEEAESFTYAEFSMILLNIPKTQKLMSPRKMKQHFTLMDKLGEEAELKAGDTVELEDQEVRLLIELSNEGWPGFMAGRIILAFDDYLNELIK